MTELQGWIVIGLLSVCAFELFKIWDYVGACNIRLKMINDRQR
jgi:hypothetical protein